MSTSTAAARGTVQSVSRAFEILEVIAQAGTAVGVTDIAERCGLPMPTVHRLLQTLAAGGYVYQTPKRRYALGARLITLARYAGGALGVALRPMLATVVANVDESASVAVLDQDFARYISHVPSERSMRMFTEVGNKVSLHATGVGKAILSQMTPEEVRHAISHGGLRRLTPTTITDPEVLLHEIETVRQRGYAIDDGEHETGVTCVAVPIPGPLHLAASISGPTSRMTPEFVTGRAVPALRHLADEVASALADYPRF